MLVILQKKSKEVPKSIYWERI